MRSQGRAPARGFRLCPLALVALIFGWTAASVAWASAGSKVVRYNGYTVKVPAAWPVFHLASNPAVCVRFDRHAVYLGTPGSNQRCPAHEVGRTEAILIEPRVPHTAGSGGRSVPALPAVTSPRAQQPQGSGAQLAVPSHGLVVTATWGRNPGLVQRALGVRSLAAVSQANVATARPPVRARSAVAGATYTGLGFDACSAPSTAQMTAWASSPYRAAGVYIGGENMGCSQPNLNASWVSQESAAGWHLIPTYVGLQAPTNSCGCAGIVPAQASAEGSAAASDAITQAQALGIGAGNPIYFDLEAYSRGGTNTSAVLAFLSAWTTQLHGDGYKSGVYGSGGSGIEDLVANVGTSSFVEPDDIWIADWNDALTTTDPYVPSGDWPVHLRIHQYDGAHNATYGGATINIDGDYVDAATAGATAVTPAVLPPPALTVSPAVDGSIHLSASWNGGTGVAAWRALGGASPTTLAAIGRAATAGTKTAITVHSQFPFFAVQALGSAGQVLANSSTVPAPPHLALYGRSTFVSPGGVGGLPAGCFTGSVCQIAMRISAGRTVIASTGPEFVQAGGGRLLYFSLTPAGRVRLAHAPGHRLPVQITARDASGVTVTAALSATPFVTKGRAPHRSLTQAETLRILSATTFVYRSTFGGTVAGCVSARPCAVRTTITVGRTVIASTGPENVGPNEVAYLGFMLSPRGKAMLAHAAGNQLGARLTVSDGTATATGAIALVSF